MTWLDDDNGNGSSDRDDMTDDRFEADRLRMVDKQIRHRGIRDPRVLRAIETVPRHHFVRPGDLVCAYDDNPLPIGYGQTISQPYIVALMTELLEIKPSHRVLEIGTGSGYQAAVLSLLAADVFSIEYIDALGRSSEKRLRSLGYDNVHVRVGDGHAGWPDEAPFDAVIVTAAPESCPPRLVDQLVEGGRMAIPVGCHIQELYLMIKRGGEMSQEKVTNVRFVPMVGSGDG
jgi:protein-L-isoaspartate(D-aspartate) O-methyltransferase